LNQFGISGKICSTCSLLAATLLYHQIFLDTEGMASFEREDGQSTNIVSLAGLLLSLLIYNQRGTFDENCLNSLGKVAVVMSDLYTHSGKFLCAVTCHALYMG
jgi:hypothetical protein